MTAALVLKKCFQCLKNVPQMEDASLQDNAILFMTQVQVEN